MAQHRVDIDAHTPSQPGVVAHLEVLVAVLERDAVPGVPATQLVRAERVVLEQEILDRMFDPPRRTFLVSGEGLIDTSMMPLLK